MPSGTGLREQLADRRARAILSGLMRYCSVKGIPPALVDERVVNDFMRYRAETTALAVDTAARRKLARVWNDRIGSVPNWPSQRLEEPPIASSEGLPWEAFPEGLRARHRSPTGRAGQVPPERQWPPTGPIQAVDPSNSPS